MTLPLPTEEFEQVALIHYLDLKGYRYFAVPNSTYTTSWKVKGRNKRMGVRRGVPDMFVILPPSPSREEGLLLAIELKRLKGGVTSPEQKEWIAALNKIGMNVCAVVCRGADEAINVIQEFMR